MSIPPLYDSFEESSDAKCIFCKQNTDDAILYGNKYSIAGMTMHNFCLVRTQKRFCFYKFIFNKLF